MGAWKLILLIILFAYLLGSCTDNPVENESQNYLKVPTSSYPTIQSAIDVANEGDIIIVQPGIYYENINMKGKNVILSSLYYFYKDESYITETIIDGQESWSVIVINNGENERCIINGFTLVNGIGAKVPYLGRAGGAIYCWRSTPTLKNLNIRNNSSSAGSAIYFSQASATLENVVISNNGKGYGAVYIAHCNPSFNNVLITENRCSGLYINDCSGIIENLVISYNSESGVYAEPGYNNVTLKKFFVIGNQKWGFAGGGMHIVNSTCVNNEGGLMVSDWATVKNSIFFNKEEKEITILQIMSGFRSVKVRYSNIKGGPDCFEIWGDSDYVSIDYDSTNFSTDPQFCNPEIGDFHLRSSSPCVTGGENGGLVGAFDVGCD